MVHPTLFKVEHERTFTRLYLLLYLNVRKNTTFASITSVQLRFLDDTVDTGKQKVSESEKEEEENEKEEERGLKEVSAPPPTAKRVPVFPGLGHSALLVGAHNTVPPSDNI